MCRPSRSCRPEDNDTLFNRTDLWLLDDAISPANSVLDNVAESCCGIAKKPRHFTESLRQRPSRCVGMEASGQGRWFERLLGELNFELWIGDAAEIRTKRVRKQKTDRQGAQLILKLLLEDRFPRIWVPSRENRDLQQLLWHRQRMVQTRTRVPAQPAQPKADILATGADSGIANATVFPK